MEDTSLVEVIELAILDRLSSLHTAHVARVVSYDATKQTVSAQPVVKIMTAETNEIKSLPIIPEIPVLYPRGGNWFDTAPIGVGDFVLLVFLERPHDQFLLDGNDQPPLDDRKFDLNSCVAIPGLFPDTQRVQASSTRRRIQIGNARIDLAPDGTFRVENLNGDELLALISDLAAQVADIGAAVSVIGGSLPTIVGALLPTAFVPITGQLAATAAAGGAASAGTSAGTAGANAATDGGKVAALTASPE